MAPKLKVGLKKKDEKPKSVSPPKASPTKYSPVSTRQLSKQVLLSYLQEAFQERFKVKVVPKSWVLPNRAKYPTFIDVTFKYGTRKPIADPKMACSECEGDKCTAQIDSIKLFPYQQFVVDFMQFASPYRGVLLYITLGGGKSCTAIAAAEALANNMKVIVMTPASLRN
ncbi:hypothetical protein EBT25_16545, partial [bacterium]|nr:hypothetical protein [bacterium]